MDWNSDRTAMRWFMHWSEFGEHSVESVRWYVDDWVPRQDPNDRAVRKGQLIHRGEFVSADRICRASVSDDTVRSYDVNAEQWTLRKFGSSTTHT